MSRKDIEYEDAYVLEERLLIGNTNDISEMDLNENLTLDSLDISDENIDIEDYTKLKLATDVSKKKIDDKKSKLIEFNPKIVRREEIVEDYIRNFFSKYLLNKTLEEFNKEYSELYKKGKFNDNSLGQVTDVHIKNAKLEEKLGKIEADLEKAKRNAEDAKSKWESLRREREFYKDKFGKTMKEKQLILNDIKTLKRLHEEFEIKISDLKIKYDNICKSKSLMDLEATKLNREADKNKEITDKYLADIDKLEDKLKNDNYNELDNKLKIPLPPISKNGDKTPWPKDIRNNLFLMQNYNPLTFTPSAGKPMKIHNKPIGCMSVHFKKHVIATGGDDATFKIFNMVNNEELASSIGHTEYISGIDIHPKGSFLATGSGDFTLKLWDLSYMKCKATFNEKSIVWSTKFHDTGDFLLSGLDNSSIKLYDINVLKVRSIYNGHTDSVNKVNFQPFTNYFASCSSDKTISIWDMRLGLTVQTYTGHWNSINDIVFNTRGDILYSCDADGIIKGWDLRKVSEIFTWMHYPGEKISANCLEVEKSNNFAYVGYENGYLGVLNLTKGILGSKIKGHESSINAIGINITNKCIYTVGSDGALIGWQ